jgi:predicted membrane protein
MQNNVWKKTMKFDFLGVLDADIILIFFLVCGCIGCIIGFIFTAENDGWIAAILLIAIIFLIVFIFTILEGAATRIEIIKGDELKKVEAKEKSPEEKADKKEKPTETKKSKTASKKSISTKKNEKEKPVSKRKSASKKTTI